MYNIYRCVNYIFVDGDFIPTEYEFVATVSSYGEAISAINDLPGSNDDSIEYVVRHE